jgi:hypothetical protein
LKAALSGVLNGKTMKQKRKMNFTPWQPTKISIFNGLDEILPWIHALNFTLR